MQTSKIWQILAFVFPAYLYGFVYAVEFEPCFPAVKNKPCNMTCRFPDFSQVIEFTCGSSIRSTCSALLCNDMIKEGGNTLYLPISSLSYSNDNCEWGCTHGGNPATSATVTIFSGYSNLTLTGEKSADGVKLTATAECLYPSNSSVVVKYSYESGGKFISLGQQQIDIQSFNVPGVCNFGIENRTTAISVVSGKLAIFEGKNVYFKMGFSQYTSAIPSYTNEFQFYFEGLTTLSSTISSDMSTTDSEVPPPSVTSSSAGLPQEIVITIIISSIFAVGVLVTLLIVLVVKRCRQKNRETLAKNKENHFTIKQGNFIKKDASKSSIESRKSKFSGKRNTKQENISLNKFKHTQFNNSQAPMNRMYEHYPQTSDYMYLNNSGNQHVFNHSHAERNMILYGNRHHSYPKSQSRPNHKMVYLSPYPEHPGHYEGMFQYYRANNLYQGQQMYQRPCVAQYDHHIKDKPINERSFEGRTYERNWDFLY